MCAKSIEYNKKSTFRENKNTLKEKEFFKVNILAFRV